MQSKRTWLIWGGITGLGTVAMAMLALSRGETVNAIWLVIAALSVYTIGYRFYSRWLAYRVLQLDDGRLTPAELHNDGMDYVPTHKWVLFGHHFAAIAGAGPLIGPVLAAQMGYLPGTLWILAGVIFAGAVQDFVVLFASTRRNGKSLGDMIRAEMGPLAGHLAMGGILTIMIILLAVLALVVVKAMMGSPWSSFTIAATIPIALFMGVYLRWLRPGRVGEASWLGFALLMLALFGGQWVSLHPTLAPLFSLDGLGLAKALIGYGFIASVLPIWLLLAPRDYLSTFLKIGTIAVLALGIVFTLPELKMPALSRFIDGTGPVFSGSLFPFLFITIACGSVSGFHALISSGTTPKMLERESHARMIGYGAMLAESFVAIMAMAAACVLEPGIYFALNSPVAVIGKDVVHAAAVINQWGFSITAEQINTMASNIGETSILSRTGGAPTLAVGMAQILSNIIGGNTMMKFWYHFAILFEALFILTTLDAGTRVGRFMIQDLLGHFYKPLGRTDSLPANLLATTLCVAGWGYFLYQGVIDPLGGINTLWPLFGIANQMLAAIALLLCTTVLIKMRKRHFAWVTMVPALTLVGITLTAGWQKLMHSNPKIGFLAQAARFQSALSQGQVLPPAKNLEQMHQIILNNQIDAVICALFMLLVSSLTLLAVRRWLQAWHAQEHSAQEAPYFARQGA